MTLLVGTDEAGYGPNLGPLVVSASVWRTSDDLPDLDLYQRLDQAVTSSASEKEPTSRLAIADSKLLYKPGGGLANLERAVLFFVDNDFSNPVAWNELLGDLDPQCQDKLADIPWYKEFETVVPVDCDRENIVRVRANLKSAFSQSSVRFEQLRSKIVFPKCLNDAIDQHGNKATALSIATLSLVRSSIADCSDSYIMIHCDKHGGRNKYGALLQQIFPEYLIEVHQESREKSVYRWGPAERRVEIHFTAKGERCMASALASMTSKYLREIAMKAFNEFWCRHVPRIRPTAGYPVDAKRFRYEIESARKRLAIDERILWRNR